MESGVYSSYFRFDAIQWNISIKSVHLFVLTEAHRFSHFRVEMSFPLTFLVFNDKDDN